MGGSPSQGENRSSQRKVLAPISEAEVPEYPTLEIFDKIGCE